VEAVKALTGGDPVVANFMHQDKIEFIPSHSLILLSNFRPQMDAAIRAVWRRLLLVPFDVEIPADKQNLSLTEEIIEAESAGVLRWLVDGAVAWWTATQGKKGASGLNPPQRVIDETREYQASEDRVGAFIEARCTLGPGKTAEGGKLFKDFREFCDEELGVKSVGRSNEFFHALSQARGADGERLGKSVLNAKSRRKEYLGIALGASDYGPVRTAEPAMNDNRCDDDPGFTFDPEEFRD
jgi:P4 family phage/plasmid primase-like protien